MSVNEIESVVLLFPNEEWRPTETNSQLDSVAQLRPNISFALTLDQNLRSLSTHDAGASGIIGGFLYVPDLAEGDPCTEIAQQYVPHNVTRQANLPPTDFTLVALAPWINAECTLAYLAAADQDPMRAIIFYLPNNGSSQPPPISSPVWDLGDGDAWKDKHDYPAYAVPSDMGEEMMYQSSLYSGNMTDVPYGHQISELPNIDPRDYVRIYTELRVSASNNILNLWLVLPIIVVVLLLMLACTSGAMHLILRSRRKSLQRRVASGEVNLEALGIKRLTVPRDQINKLPLFTYHLQEEDRLRPASRTKKNSTSTTTTVEQDDASEGSSENRASKSQDLPSPLSPVSRRDDIALNPDSMLPHKYLPYSQPTCPICLDDFESGTTPIRELPCGHIFHPECIDSFLSNNSSLCPMCKKSVLPKGYCPEKITNSMVRRERNIRRLRSRVVVNDESDIESDNTRNRIRRYRANVRRVFQSSTRSREQQDEITGTPAEPQSYLMTTSSVAADPQLSVLDNVASESHDTGLTRQEIAQRRILELAAGQPPLGDPDPDVANERQRSKWRNIVARVFPGFS